MPKAKVLNVGKESYSEDFKGKNITIPAGGFIVMELFDATAFKGQYPGKGKIKQIKVQQIPGNDPQHGLFVCNFCGKTFGSDKELLGHSKAHSESPEEIKTEPEVPPRKKSGRPTNDELRRRKEMKNDTGTNIGDNKGAN